MEPFFAIFVSLVMAWLCIGFATVASLYVNYFGILPLARYIHGMKSAKQEREIRHFLLWHPLVVFFSCLAEGPVAVWIMTGSIRDDARENLRRKLNREHKLKKLKG